jgi:glycosyltransferase involved in cell wall biosynthesis
MKLPWRTANAVRVSVVVPLHNPSTGFDELCASLWAQSLPDDAYEVVFVDDGSTDDTPERLARLAREHPNVRVHRIPASGWPGRPRNVGVEHARGTYVFFSDQDDELFPEALERMCATADEHASDVVMGKVVQAGANTPYWPLWRRDVAVADLVHDGVTLSRTVHKLFRRSFLLDHDIRFPEGPVRLEDYHVMGQVFAASPRVSVLASYPCYRWIKHPGNTSSRPTDPAEYWGYFTEAMNLVDTLGGPADVSDALKIAATGQAFTRPFIASWLRHPRERQAEELAATAQWVDDAVPARLDDRQPLVRRAHLQALRRRDEPAYRAAQELRSRAHATDAVVTAGWTSAGLLRIEVTARMELTGRRVVDPLGGERWSVPGLPDDGTFDLRVLDVDRPTGELTVRDRAVGTEWPVDTRIDVAPEWSGAVVRVVGEIDPPRGTFGRPLDPGIWDVRIQLAMLGRSFSRRVTVPEDTLPTGVGGVVHAADGLEVTPYRTAAGTLALRVRAAAVPAGAAADG